jgi:hypothetical protein
MIDWFRVITDLERVYSLAQIGRAVNLDAVTVWRYKGGAEPKHSVGVALLDMHSKLPKITS